MTLFGVSNVNAIKGLTPFLSKLILLDWVNIFIAHFYQCKNVLLEPFLLVKKLRILFISARYDINYLSNVLVQENNTLKFTYISLFPVAMDS